MKELIGQFYEDRTLFVLAFLGALLVFWVALSADIGGSIRNKIVEIEEEKNVGVAAVEQRGNPLNIEPSITVGGYEIVK